MSMSFVKNERQQRIYDQLNQFIPQFRKRAPLHDEEGSFPFDNIEDLKSMGYPTFTLPAEYGGKELSLYEFVLFQEQIARGDGATALSIGWHIGITMDLAEKRPWSDEMIDFLFKEISRGALINTAATEPKTGSPTRGGKPETTAKKTADGWVINGHKTFTSMSVALDYIFVTATIDETEEVGQFIIPKDAKGVSIQETWDLIGMRGTASHDLMLEDVEIPSHYLTQLLSTPQKKKPSGWLLHIPACYMGIALAARDYAVQFANDYSPNSLPGPIRELPTIQQAIGEIELELLSARHFMYGVAQKWDESSDRTQLGAELGAVKHVVTNTAVRVVDRAMRIVGAKSLQQSNPMQRYYRDVRAGLHNPPMDDMTIANLAANAFKELEDDQ